METVDENFIAGDVMQTIKTPTPFNISIEGYDVIAVMRRAYLSLCDTDEVFHYVFTALDSKGDAVVALWCDKEEISSLGEAGSWLSFKDPEAAIAFMIKESGVNINVARA